MRDFYHSTFPSTCRPARRTKESGAASPSSSTTAFIAAVTSLSQGFGIQLAPRLPRALRVAFGLAEHSVWHRYGCLHTDSRPSRSPLSPGQFRGGRRVQLRIGPRSVFGIVLIRPTPAAHWRRPRTPLRTGRIPTGAAAKCSRLLDGGVARGVTTKRPQLEAACGLPDLNHATEA